MEAARKWLSQAVKLDSHSYLAHYYYASMAMSDGGLSDAPAIEASLKTAIKLNPAFAPSYDRLASLYRMQHEHLDEAHMLELQATELDPANLHYRINAANLLVQLKREDDALRVLQNARPLAKNPSQTAMLNQTIHAIQQNQSMIANQAERMAQLKTAVIEATSAASPHPSASADAPKHTARGIIQSVRCNGAVLELQVQNAAQTIALYSNNYFKIEFAAINDTSPGDIQPCRDLEGKPALVSYAESADKTAAGEIVSIALGGSQVSEHIAASATAPRREARGIIHGVRCGPPSILELEVDGAAKKLALYTNDYYKISFLAMNYQPDGEIHPCTDLEGKHAIVLYAVTDDKTAAGQILSIALSR
jgi:hypothetical protein